MLLIPYWDFDVVTARRSHCAEGTTRHGAKMNGVGAEAVISGAAGYVSGGMATARSKDNGKELD
jgi:hypothetical protein